MQFLHTTLPALLCLPWLALGGCANDFSTAKTTASAGLSKLTRKATDQRVAVAIYEVTCAVPELTVRGATEMFKTALVKSGQFRVVERAKLNRALIIEKQMNAAGQTSGSAAQSKLRGAEFLFQMEITEVAAGTATDSGGINLAGLQLGGARNRDQIGIDVSIVNAANGDVVDAINVRKELGSSATSVSGVGSLVNTVLVNKGKTPSPYTPEVQYKNTRKESMDAALREAIEEAVRLLGQRFRSDA